MLWLQGKNCYYTGKAGTGKSHLLKEIIKRAPAGKTFITASTGALSCTTLSPGVTISDPPCARAIYCCLRPTGIAAVNIGGTTLHSFSGEHQ